MYFSTVKKHFFQTHPLNFVSILLLVICITSCSKSGTNSVDFPGGGEIDNQLVAHWKQSYASTIEIETGPGGNHSIPSGEFIDFIFLADGNYTQTFFNQSSLGCTIVVLGTKKGKWHVDNSSTVYLDETYSHIKAMDDCNPVYNMDKDINLKRIKYVYHFSTEQNGDQNLHLETNSGDDVFYQ